MLTIIMSIAAFLIVCNLILLVLLANFVVGECATKQDLQEMAAKLEQNEIHLHNIMGRLTDPKI